MGVYKTPVIIIDEAIAKKYKQDSCTLYKIFVPKQDIYEGIQDTCENN